MTTRIRLRDTADLLATLPFQLGYHPRDSVVAVVVRDGRLGMVARLDLPPPDQVDEVAGALVPPVLREDPDAVLLVGYEPSEGAARPVLDSLAVRFADAEVEVRSRVVVRDDRWYGLDCDQACCPAEGTPVPEAASSPGAAEYVALGIAPLGTRDDLVRLVTADPDRSADVAAALARPTPVEWAGQALGRPPEAGGRSRAVRRMRWLTAWARVVDLRFATEDPELDTAMVAEFVRSLRDVQLRDGLIAWLCPGSLPLTELDEDLVDLLQTCLPPPEWASSRRTAASAGHRVVSRFQSLARAVPDEHCAPVLTVLAQVAWWLGDGAVARTALDRALAHEPGYRLAVLLERMVDLALRPAGPEGVTRSGVATTRADRSPWGRPSGGSAPRPA
jgi:hypothetical protein